MTRPALYSEGQRKKGFSKRVKRHGRYQPHDASSHIDVELSLQEDQGQEGKGLAIEAGVLG